MQKYIVEYGIPNAICNTEDLQRHISMDPEDLQKYLNKDPHPLYRLVSTQAIDGTFILVWELKQQ